MIEGILMKIEPIHWVLAYMGMLLHLLIKINEDKESPTFLFSKWVEKNMISIIISFLMIPVLLFVATEPLVKSVLPINNVTAVLVGFQTQSIFRSITVIFKIKK